MRIKSGVITYLGAVLLIVSVIALWFVLAFVVIGPFFTQLLGDLVYFGRDRVWIYSIVVILGSFLFLSGINYLIIGRLTKPLRRSA